MQSPGPINVWARIQLLHEVLPNAVQSERRVMLSRDPIYCSFVCYAPLTALNPNARDWPSFCSAGGQLFYHQAQCWCLLIILLNITDSTYSFYASFCLQVHNLCMEPPVSLGLQY